ncbi:hypothetical protein TrLO_g4926 [Triparma laevis f. longispina]|uniref:Uncharacterized protein n=1 Tax=Triparma laevis f. longispina TaxID=1714387 RepID=A0A9W7C952_9STRA|nr:hypothetical protein TrLO_g4926 [Triparma laevis f. longispina]
MGGETILRQIIRITSSEDLEKLKALQKLTSPSFFNDVPLLASVDRRILELLSQTSSSKISKGKKKGKKTRSS